MMKANRRGLALVLIFAIPALYNAEAQEPCSVPAGLYARFQRVKEQYSQQVGNNYVANKAVADDILAREERAAARAVTR